jgi:hypothetical protein
VESRKETRMPEDSLIVITNAIKTAFIDHPSSGHGTTWDQITKSDEESIHLAKAVLIALRKAGYSISKVEEEECPEALKARSGAAANAARSALGSSNHF